MADLSELPAVCLYETLGAERTASSEEIRILYRKQALKWHPDKIQQSGASPEECKEATIRFQAISHAYEVLSDPQERAWYDSHRGAILSSSSNRSATSSSSSPAGHEYDTDLFSYFSPSAYSGFGDSGKGFYAVYDQLFQKLHQQEVAFAKAYGGTVPQDPPRFGCSATPHAMVLAFYRRWQGFSTVKDFSWCDEYRPSSAPNRKTRRLMEEENLKIRKVARREFNDTVRQLASYVKKRDKRVLEWQLEQQRLEKERQEMLKLRKQRLEEEKRAKLLLYEEEEWTKPVQDGTGTGPDDEEVIDENQGSYAWDSSGRRRKEVQVASQQELEELFCIVCHKRFRSDKQWKNHEKSKKHIARVEALRDKFQLEDELVEEFLAKELDTSALSQDDGSEVEPVMQAQDDGLREDDALQENGFLREQDELQEEDDSQEEDDLQEDDDLEEDELQEEDDLQEEDEASVLREMLTRRRSQPSTGRNSTNDDEDGETVPSSSEGTANGAAKEDYASGNGKVARSTVEPTEDEEDGMMSAMLNSMRSRRAVSVAEDEEISSKDDVASDRGNALNVEGLDISSGDEAAELPTKSPDTQTNKHKGARARRRARQEKKQTSVVHGSTNKREQETRSPAKGKVANVTEVDFAKARKKNSGK